MAITSNLTSYVDQSSKEIIRKVILGGTAQKYFDVKPGIKTSKEFTLLSNTIYIQEGGACGATESGSTVLNPFVLSVDDCFIKQGICLDTLEDTSLSALMQAGSNNEELPTVLGQAYIENWLNLVDGENEKIIFRGRKGGSGNLRAHDGLLHKISATTYSASCIFLNSTTGATTQIGSLSSYTATNAYDNLTAVLAQMPEDAISSPDGLVIFMSIPYFLATQTCFVNKNWSHFDPTQQTQSFEMMLPFTTTKIVGTKGLNLTNNILVTTNKNFGLGCDLLEDKEEVKTWFSDDDDKFYAQMKYKQGVGIKFPEWTALVAIG